MNNASLYNRSNEMQRQDAKDVLQRFSQQIQWRSDGTDTLLDIGCGTGDVTIDFILPIMPKNFRKLVGVDISEDMVEYARQRYQNSMISFEILNIAGSIESILHDHPDGFDFITSFYCLNWVWNQELAIKNIYDLLKPSASCLLMFLANHPLFDVYKELSKTSKWSSIMKNFKQYTTPYQDCENPCADFGQLLERTGFSKHNVEISERTYTPDGGRSTAEHNISAVNPFVVNMTPMERKEFIEDIFKTFKRMKLVQKVEGDSEEKSISYKLIIAFAKK